LALTNKSEQPAQWYGPPPQASGDENPLITSKMMPLQVEEATQVTVTGTYPSASA
jgi:hypothetical protein